MADTPHTISHEPPAPAASSSTHPTASQAERSQVPAANPPTAAQIFSRAYFNGGHPVYGGIRPFLNDRPQNEIISRKVLERKPESVLEMGAGRGYTLKRIQDAGVRAAGFDVSRHCYMTRTCENIVQHDLTVTPWPGILYGAEGATVGEKAFDLCFSFGFLEHVPEGSIPALAAEMARTCRRGLHGVTVPGRDDGSDLSRTTVYPPEWWRKHLPAGHEVVPKEDLEQGGFPQEVLQGDGKKRVNLGCCYTMSHHGWLNCDILDLTQYAAMNGYHFQRFDARQGLPFATGEVAAVMMCHMLEHISYAEGVALLRECRRVIAPDGVLRFLVPDAGLLTSLYCSDTNQGGDWGGSTERRSLTDFDEVSEGCADAPTAAGKLHALLHEAHLSMYDAETLCKVLDEAGFDPLPGRFRRSNAGAAGEYVLRTTIDMHPSLSLIVEATPKLA